MVDLLRLGQLLRDRRGERGIRAVANEIKVSPATLSRVERGHLPDMLTLTKICAWLEIDPAMMVPSGRAAVDAGSAAAHNFDDVPAVHFRADVELTPGAAADLAELILAAQAEMRRRRL
jgi:transcriptional regulator with XRE-family HTH domain